MKEQVFTIATTTTRSGILRVPSGMSAALGMRGQLRGRLKEESGRTHPVVLNLEERTLIGLQGWIHSKGDQLPPSITLRITGLNPLDGSFSGLTESEGSSSGTGTPSGILHRPGDGLYLGERLEPKFLEVVRTGEPYLLKPGDLVRHVFICGVTGAGKTVLGKAIVEEAARLGVPCLIVDLKGDLSSMALFATGEDPTELRPYVTPRNGESREETAVRESMRHRENLACWGISPDNVRDLQSTLAVNVFTPRSSAGFRLALSAFVAPPDDPATMRESNPDEYEEVVDFLAESFVSRLDLGRNQARKAHGYICEIIKFFWQQEIKIDGYEGLKRVLDELRTGESPISMIGGMPLGEYITDRDRTDIATRVNHLLTGAAQLWFRGIPLDVGLLVDRDMYGGKTPVSIVNIQHLDFEDQAYVVAYLAYMVWFWMRKQPGSEDPRLVFFVDEIGGGGGRRGLYPSVSNSPAKTPLNLLLRQGRSQGVCCAFATQNPGDIDYKGLSNCGTWAVGQLRTKRDRSKIEEGAGDAELDFEAARPFIPTLAAGQFVIRTPSQTWSILQERWLASYHRTLASNEIRSLRDEYERCSAELLTKAHALYSHGEWRRACDVLDSLVGPYRFSGACSKAYLLKARCQYSMGKFPMARETLRFMDRLFYDSDEVPEARLLLGKCHEREGHYAEALKAFEGVSDLSSGPEILNQASLHVALCRAFIEWPSVSVLKKIALWLVRRSPESASLERLEVVDDEVVARAVRITMPVASLFVPAPVNDAELARLEANQEALNETLRRRGRDLVAQIRDALEKSEMIRARGAADRLVQEFTGARLPLPREASTAIRQYNEARRAACEEVRSRVRAAKARQFEVEVAGWMAELGYQVQVTRITGDEGVDVWAADGVERIAVQCKRWDKPVGPGPVRELRGTLEQHRASRAILVSLMGFTQEAVETAKQLRVELLPATQLLEEVKRRSVAGRST